MHPTQHQASCFSITHIPSQANKMAGAVYLAGLFIGRPGDGHPLLRTKMGKGLRFSEITPVRVPHVASQGSALLGYCP